MPKTLRDDLCDGAVIGKKYTDPNTNQVYEVIDLEKDVQIRDFARPKIPYAAVKVQYLGGRTRHLNLAEHFDDSRAQESQLAEKTQSDIPKTVTAPRDNIYIWG